MQEGCRAIGFGLGIPGRSDLGLVEDIARRPRLPRRAAQPRARAHHPRRPRARPGSARRTRSRTCSPHPPSLAPPASRPRRIRDAIRDLPHRPPPHRGRRDRRRGHLDRRLEGDQPARRRRLAAARRRRVVWIVGGLLKGVDLAPLVERHAARLRGAILIGVDRDELRAAFGRHAPDVPVFEVDGPDTERGDARRRARGRMPSRSRATPCSSLRRRHRWTSSPTTRIADGDSPRRCDSTWEGRADDDDAAPGPAEPGAEPRA